MKYFIFFWGPGFELSIASATKELDPYWAWPNLYIEIDEKFFKFLQENFTKKNNLLITNTNIT